jgi:hypothetical protein
MRELLTTTDATGRRCALPGCEARFRDSGRGRPALYCSDACRETSKLMDRLRSHVERAASKAESEDALRALRSWFASELNAALNHHAARVRRSVSAGRTASDVPTVAPTSATSVA